MPPAAVKQFLKKYKDFLSESKKRWKKIKKNYYFLYFAEFIFILSFYGLMVNLVLNQFFGFEFSLLKIMASGILAYFFKSEIPHFIKACRTGMIGGNNGSNI